MSKGTQELKMLLDNIENTLKIISVIEFTSDERQEVNTLIDQFLSNRMLQNIFNQVGMKLVSNEKEQVINRKIVETNGVTSTSKTWIKKGKENPFDVISILYEAQDRLG